MIAEMVVVMDGSSGSSKINSSSSAAADRNIFITPSPLYILSVPQLPLHQLQFHFQVLRSELTEGDLRLPLLTLLR